MTVSTAQPTTDRDLDALHRGRRELHRLHARLVEHARVLRPRPRSTEALPSVAAVAGPPRPPADRVLPASRVPGSDNAETQVSVAGPERDTVRTGTPERPTSLPSLRRGVTQRVPAPQGGSSPGRSRERCGTMDTSDGPAVEVAPESAEPVGQHSARRPDEQRQAETCPTQDRPQQVPGPGSRAEGGRTLRDDPATEPTPVDRVGAVAGHDAPQSQPQPQPDRRRERAAGILNDWRRAAVRRRRSEPVRTAPLAVLYRAGLRLRTNRLRDGDEPFPPAALAAVAPGPAVVLRQGTSLVTVGRQGVGGGLSLPRRVEARFALAAREPSASSPALSVAARGPSEGLPACHADDRPMDGERPARASDGEGADAPTTVVQAAPVRLGTSGEPMAARIAQRRPRDADRRPREADRRPAGELVSLRRSGAATRPAPAAGRRNPTGAGIGTAARAPAAEPRTGGSVRRSPRPAAGPQPVTPKPRPHGVADAVVPVPPPLPEPEAAPAARVRVAPESCAVAATPSPGAVRWWQVVPVVMATLAVAGAVLVPTVELTGDALATQRLIDELREDRPHTGTLVADAVTRRRSVWLPAAGELRYRLAHATGSAETAAAARAASPLHPWYGLSELKLAGGGLPKLSWPDPTWRAALADRWLRFGEDERALAAYADYLATHPEDTAAVLRRLTGRIDAGRLRGLAPVEPRALLAAGETFGWTPARWQRAWDAADFDLAALTPPQTLAAAQVRRHCNRPAEALELLRDYLRREPRDAATHLTAARMLYASGDYAACRAHLRAGREGARDAAVLAELESLRRRVGMILKTRPDGNGPDAERNALLLLAD